ncbi:MAG: UbiX family flavin prenyltransferase, partial [Helicobacter japonicus]|nr:UbiX family flavin prenyltransferase [Helicobacter japonicus]
MCIKENKLEIKKLVIGIGGASGVHLGLKFIEYIPDSIELFVVISEGAKAVALNEMGEDIECTLDKIRHKRHFRIYNEDELDSSVSSGSFGVNAMAIVPTSMNLLAKIANGLCDDLISRCASIMLKEKRTLLLAPREMPLSPIALEQMSRLSSFGVIVAPPIVGYYAKPSDLESMECFFVGKWLDALKIPNNLYKRWKHHIEGE